VPHPEEEEDVHEVGGGRAFRSQPLEAGPWVVGIDVGGVVLIHQARSRGAPVPVPYFHHVLQMLVAAIGQENVHFITTIGATYTLQETLTTLTDLEVLDVLVPACNVHGTDDDQGKANKAKELGVTVMVDDRANVLRMCAAAGIYGLLFSRNGHAMNRWQNFRSFNDLVRQVDNWVAVWQILHTYFGLPGEPESPLPWPSGVS
jgi:hypothetical protein